MMINNIRKNLVCMSFLVAIVLLPLMIADSEARQFRLLSPIASPHQEQLQLPNGAMPVEDVKELTREQVEPLINKVIEQWNTSEMAGTLSEEFYDKSRLLDVVDTGVPRDAKLRVESIQGIQTLSQYIKPNASSGVNERVSIVSATVRTQLEFNSATSGYVRRTGTNEFILKVTAAENL